jgi:hypothetical protein
MPIKRCSNNFIVVWVWLTVNRSSGLRRAHKNLRGYERLKVRQDFLRANTPPDAKPLVIGKYFYQPS